MHFHVARTAHVHCIRIGHISPTGHAAKVQACPESLVRSVPRSTKQINLPGTHGTADIYRLNYAGLNGKPCELGLLVWQEEYYQRRVESSEIKLCPKVFPLILFRFQFALFPHSKSN